MRQQSSPTHEWHNKHVELFYGWSLLVITAGILQWAVIYESKWTTQHSIYNVWFCFQYNLQRKTKKIFYLEQRPIDEWHRGVYVAYANDWHLDHWQNKIFVFSVCRNTVPFPFKSIAPGPITFWQLMTLFTCFEENLLSISIGGGDDGDGVI